MSNIYLSPASKATSELIEKRSRFIGNIAPINNEDEALLFIKTIKKEYYDANHNVYAYICDDINRYSDDGEPSKTAGFPILDMLLNIGISSCVCVVTRYFGGTLLGTGGLVRAYTNCAKMALDNAGIKKQSLHDTFKVIIPYNLFDSFKYISSNIGAVVGDCTYSDVICADVICESDITKLYIEKINATFMSNIKYEHTGQMYI